MQKRTVLADMAVKCSEKTARGLTIAAESLPFGRADGRAVGFVTCTSPEPSWHLSFVTADRTFGGSILELSIENVELTIVAPRVVYEATTGEQATTLQVTAGPGCE